MKLLTTDFQCRNSLYQAIVWILFHCFIDFSVIQLDPHVMVITFGTVCLFSVVLCWFGWVCRVKRVKITSEGF